jgi:hypothetical protein
MRAVPPSPVLINLALDPNPASLNSIPNSIGTVTLDQAAPSDGVAVKISGDGFWVTVPTTVNVPQGATDATFAIKVNNIPDFGEPVPISATLGPVTKKEFLKIPGVVLVTLALDPDRADINHPSTGAVTLDQAAPADGIDVQISSGDASLVTVPNIVTVSEGAKDAKFDIKVIDSPPVDTSVPISATLGPVTKTESLQIKGVILVKLALNPKRADANHPSTGTVTLDQAAPAGGIAVKISSGDASLVTVPNRVTVSEGTTDAKFDIKVIDSPPVDKSVPVYATLGPVTKTEFLTIPGVPR